MAKCRLGATIMDKLPSVAISIQTRQFCCNSGPLVNFRWSAKSSSSSSSTDSKRDSTDYPSRRDDVPRITIGHDSDNNNEDKIKPAGSESQNQQQLARLLEQRGIDCDERPPPPPKSTNSQQLDHEGRRRSSVGSFSKSSRRLIEAHEEYERQIWRAARNYRQSDHYDYSLFGSHSDLDQAVARHQREAMQYSQDRHLKEEQAKLVAPNMRQSPIAIMTMNPTYELQNKPLAIDYPARVENLRLNNTGFSWEVKIPYQISMTTALHGAHLNQSHRYRLDQFHCHWGSDNRQGSEHTVDNNHYSAEMHFVHYNMEKYHTMSKAARHPDGLVVLSVFLEASDEHHNHSELEKIVGHLKHVPLKGEHSIIRQAVHIENLLPQNRSYWSYQGSLTTPPYFESVTWFIFKHPIRCNSGQIQRFRNLRSSLRADEEGHRIDTNHRKTQPLNGRSIVNYDEHQNGNSVSHATNSGNNIRSNSSHSHH